MSERIVYNYVNTPLGQILLASSSRGLCRLDLSRRDMDRLYDWARKVFDHPVVEKGISPFIRDGEKQVKEYMEGRRRSFSLTLDLRGTAFQRRVWQALLQIPYGSVVSYKEVALRIDNPKAVRAVGQANNRNPVAIIVPCHRVVGSDGSLVGYGGGLDLKKRLLRLEGMAI